MTENQPKPRPTPKPKPAKPKPAKPKPAKPKPAKPEHLFDPDKYGNWLTGEPKGNWGPSRDPAIKIYINRKSK